MTNDDLDDAEEFHIPIRAQIPIELPPPPDLSNLPSHVLHSGTVETLIGQNDDLMARLKVNIRRNSRLEKRILEYEHKHDELIRANEALNSQIQVYEEKDILMREKAERVESKETALREELSLLSAKNSSLEERNRELRLAARYMRRIRRWVTPFIDQLKLDLSKERKSLLAKEAAISDLRARLSEATSHALALERQAVKDQAALVERYETNQKKMQAELEKARAEAKLLRDKAARVEQVVAESAGQANRIVFLERHSAELMDQINHLKRNLKIMEAEAANRELAKHQPQAPSNC